MRSRLSPIKGELAIWRDQGRILPFWWRDDDATAPTAALDRLLDLAARFEAPLHLAVIPEPATAELADHLRDKHTAFVLPHGLAHRNHAPASEKKAEFGGHRPAPAMLADIATGRRKLDTLFGAQALPVFTPPWNRIATAVVEGLPGIGMKAFSTFGPRPSAFAAPGLAQVNTHVDPIDWHHGGGLIDPDRLADGIAGLLADRRAGSADAGEPFGLLTHHLVHREDIWSFAEQFLLIMAESGVARWTSPLPESPQSASVRNLQP